MRFEKFSSCLRTMLGTLFVIALALGPASGQSLEEGTEALSTLPMITTPTLSPTGRYLAVRQSMKGRYTVVIYDLHTDESPFGWALPEGHHLINYMWVADDRILVETIQPAWMIYLTTAGRGRHTRFEFHTYTGSRIVAHVIDPDGDNYLNLYGLNIPFPQALGTTRIVDPLDSDPDHIIATPIALGRHPLMRYNIREQEDPREIDDGRETTQAWLADHDGNVRLRIDADESEVQIFARHLGRSRWRRILRSRYMDQSTFDPLTFSGDGHSIYVQSDHEDRSGLYRIDLRYPDNLERIYLHDEVDMGGVIFSGDDFEPAATLYTEDRTRIHFFDEDFAHLNRRLANSLPGSDVYIANSARYGNVHVVVSTGPSTPPVYYLLNETEGTLQPIEAAFPGLEDMTFGLVEAVTYRARDGTLIHGYVTYPPNHQGGPLPMVVLPHGGPHARDTMDFDPMTHMFAARGYAVFQMNFRGSTGYGREFMRAGYGEWGGVMQDDMVDGIDAMIDLGVADPERICLVGFSYGGYTAMLEAMRRPDRFRCVAAVAGVHDLVGFLESPNGQLGATFWNASIGTVEEDRRQLDANSPQSLVRAGLPPIFLAHGEIDFTVPVEQSHNLGDALSGAGYSVTQRYFPNSTHQFDYEPERIELFLELAEFVDRHLAP